MHGLLGSPHRKTLTPFREGVHSGRCVRVNRGFESNGINIGGSFTLGSITAVKVIFNKEVSALGPRDRAGVSPKNPKAPSRIVLRSLLTPSGAPFGAPEGILFFDEWDQPMTALEPKS